MPREDPFARVDYRRMVAWKGRLERELPLLREVLGPPGEGFVLDVGCGTGEHVEALRREGYRSVGLDVSAALLGEARQAYPQGRWILGDMLALPLRGQAILDGALSLGNTLALVLADAELERLFGELARLLRRGAPFLIQLLNYRRIRTLGIRHLPLNFRPVEEGELLYLRLMDPLDERTMRFEVLTLARRPPDGETELVRRSTSRVRSLFDTELQGLLQRGGFREVTLLGGFDGRPYEPRTSQDVIAVARP